MRIALATCANLPDWEVDDRPLFRTFAARQVEAPLVVWDDPAVNWAIFDAVLIRTTWDYMEKRERYIAWAEHVERVSRLFNPARIVRWNTHKTYLKDLAARGVPIAPTIWLQRGDAADIRQVMRERDWLRGFIKPVIGATARETLRFVADEEGLARAQMHLDRMLAREDMMIQPYLARVETEGEVSAIFVDGEITHCVRKVPVPGDYRVQDDFGAHDEPIDFTPAERDLALRVVEAANHDLLYARTDFLRDDEGRLVLTEFEAVEPSMFFRHCPAAAARLADALLRRLA
jgi:glutathione synthase/RimK-type ligase-like ATP-grasp enzyme